MRCLNCDSGNIIIGIHCVTREMAHDACEPQMEGMEEVEFGQCPCCDGVYQECKHCAESHREEVPG